MFNNYFKIAWRNLVKNRVSSIINIGGLAAGMAVALLIALWIYDEFSFNKSFNNYQHIGRIMQTQTFGDNMKTAAVNPMPLGAELVNSFGSSFENVVLSTQTKDYIISSGDKKFTQAGNYMQAQAPAMFTLQMVYGNRKALDDSNSILLSETLSKKLFGREYPMGKLVKIDNELNVKVTGVYKDFPLNTEFHDVAFIAPWNLLISSYSYIKDHENDWNGNFANVYVQLKPNSDFAAVSQKIKDVKVMHANKQQVAFKPSLFIEPMRDWHLYSSYENGVAVTSQQMQFIKFYSIIGAFVLLLACINFMNLSTARSEKRAKEVGIRKAIGSPRSQLVMQFFSESLVVVLVALIVAIGVVQLTLPWFNTVAAKKMSIPFADGLFWLGCTVFTFVTALVSGSYPAFYLSSFRPVKVLKGAFRAGRLAAIPRKVLVVFQFSVSVILIVGTCVVFRQVQFAKNRPVGYSRDGLIMVQKTSDDFRGKHDVLRAGLLNSGVVQEVAEASSPVTEINAFNGGFTWKGKDPANNEISFATLGVSHEYGNAVNWQFTAGRDFSKAYASDSSAFIINETAAKLMGLKNPVGETINWQTDFYDGGNFKIIGVVKDMVMKSPFEPVKPAIFFLQGYKGWVLIKMNAGVSASQALPKIEAVFKQVVPTVPFDYRFADDEYAAKFASEERTGTLAGFFTGLAVLISCLGLFGLATFMAEQRIKEIGVRKILGASITNLWGLLSKDFITLVVISLFIAMPVAYYFMHNWLQQYAYRSNMPWWVFAGAGAGAIIIAVLTVSYQSIKAALMNPVKSLRSE